MNDQTCEMNLFLLLVYTSAYVSKLGSGCPEKRLTQVPSCRMWSLQILPYCTDTQKHIWLLLRHWTAEGNICLILRYQKLNIKYDIMIKKVKTWQINVLNLARNLNAVKTKHMQLLISYMQVNIHTDALGCPSYRKQPTYILWILFNTHLFQQLDAAMYNHRYP
jgi:hypothetical protein